MSKTEKLLRELIALPSVNPAFLPAQDPRAGEQRAADFLAATAAQAGLEVEFQSVFPGRSNLLARLCPSGKVRQRVVLAPHLGSATVEARTAMADLAAENLLAALAGRRPPHPVNPEVLAAHRPSPPFRLLL